MEQTAASAAQRRDITPFVGLAVLAGLLLIGWEAPSRYEIYKMIHVIAAVVWVGGGVMLTILALLTERANDPVALANIGKQAEYVAQRIFIPAGVVVLVFGIAMIEKGDLGWGHFWIDFALVAWAITFLVGSAFLGPQTKKLNALVEEHGVEHPLTQAKLKLILTVARLDVAMLLLVVADMTAKPFA